MKYGEQHTLHAEQSPCCGIPTSDTVELKTQVKEKYARIAEQAEDGCCGDGYSMIGDAYTDLQGYLPDADLGLGCGLPTEFADLVEGQKVLDLGSGAGLDAFVARRYVGTSGRVLGIDFVPAMVNRARDNARTLGYDNVEFYLGDIEAIPLAESSVDVILSNCVLNLVPNKPGAFAEMFRVLRTGGTFCISDIVYQGSVPVHLRQQAERYVGCVAGSMEQKAYLQTLQEAGFCEVQIVTSRRIEVPVDLPEGAIMSITVSGTKRA